MKKIMIFIMIFVLIIFLLIYFFHTTKKEENVVLLGVECDITDINTSDKTLTIIGAGNGREIIQQESKIDCKDLEKDGKIVEFNSSNEPNILKVKQIELIRKN